MATIYKRGRVYWVSYKDRNGRRIQKSTGKGDRKAAECLRKHYAALEKSHHLIGTPLAAGIRLSDLRREYRRNREGRKAAKTVNQDRIALDSFQAAVGDPFAGDVKPENVDRWYSDLLKRRSAATANSYFRHVRAFFNYAVKRRYLGESPAKELDTVSEVEGKTRTLSRDEAARILAVLPPAWADLCRVALYTGCRAGELCRIKTADLDPDFGAVTVSSEPDNPTKSRKFRVVPLPAASRPFFRALAERANEYLLRTERGNPWRVDWISRGFTRYAKKAGVPCTFHDLRRTYGGWLVMSGADLITVKENMGHSDISVTVRHYVHLVMDHKRAQVDRLPEL